MLETSRVGLGLLIGGPSLIIDWDLELKILVDSRAGASICYPDPTSMVVGILCGCMRPWWWGRENQKGKRGRGRQSATSMKGSGSPIDGPNPESTKDSESEVPGRFGPDPSFPFDFLYRTKMK
ncbi:hypothetical protein CRG98_033840 [Punica granatum]|uniref:Uncharacterized protein n=1 Tax=Punica granatum TaxID=22663 RepID=A0A2I0IQ45_PUNGR|nr:hypothetical protein CRG98_033840 [Punica granatum]